MVEPFHQEFGAQFDQCVAKFIYLSEKSIVVNCAWIDGFGGGRGQEILHSCSNKSHLTFQILTLKDLRSYQKFPKGKMTYGFKFPKMASFWNNFNSTFHHQKSFKWNFVEHESCRSFSPISKKSKIVRIGWTVEEIWSNYHRACMAKFSMYRCTRISYRCVQGKKGPCIDAHELCVDAHC